MVKSCHFSIQIHKNSLTGEVPIFGHLSAIKHDNRKSSVSRFVQNNHPPCTSGNLQPWRSIFNRFHWWNPPFWWMKATIFRGEILSLVKSTIFPYFHYIIHYFRRWNAAFSQEATWSRCVPPSSRASRAICSRRPPAIRAVSGSGRTEGSTDARWRRRVPDGAGALGMVLVK